MHNEGRIASSNLRALVNALNRGERVYARGNRVVKGQHNNQQSAYSGAHNNGTNNQNVQSNRGNMNNSYRGRGQRGRGQGHRGQGHRGNTGRGGNRRQVKIGFWNLNGYSTDENSDHYI